MIRSPFSLALAALLLPATAQEEIEPATRIPVDLQDAVMAMHDLAPEGDLIDYRKGETDEENLTATLGITLRGRWQLWGDSPLARYFRSKGVLHPDHMSGVVLQAWMDAAEGREVPEDFYFHHFPTWLNEEIVLEPTANLRETLAAFRAEAASIARNHFENPAAVVAFSHAFDPAKERLLLSTTGQPAIFRDAFKAVLKAAGLTYEVVSFDEIRIVDLVEPSAPPRDAGRQTPEVPVKVRPAGRPAAPSQAR